MKMILILFSAAILGCGTLDEPVPTSNYRIEIRANSVGDTIWVAQSVERRVVGGGWPYVHWVNVWCDVHVPYRYRSYAEAQAVLQNIHENDSIRVAHQFHPVE